MKKFKLHNQIVGEEVTAEQAAQRIKDAKGPVLYMGEISRADLPQLKRELARKLCRETDVEAAKKKRPMIDRTFVPVGPEHEPVSLRDLDHKQFWDWARSYLNRADVPAKPVVLATTTAREREQLLRQFVTLGISPLMLTE